MYRTRRIYRYGGIRTQDAHTGDDFVVIHKDTAHFPTCGNTPGVKPCFRIVVFDANQNTFESGQRDVVYVSHVTTDNNSHSVLHLVDVNNNPVTLSYSYTRSPYPDFSSGESAGVCVVRRYDTPTSTWYDCQELCQEGNVTLCYPTDVQESCFYEADTTQLNRTATHDGPFDDAFVSFYIDKNGKNVIPYLPTSWFDYVDAHPLALASLSNIWFDHFLPSSGTPPPDKPHNYFHVMGGSDSTKFVGVTLPDYDVSVILRVWSETNCGASLDTCIRHTTSHEIAHQFHTNACTNLQDCAQQGVFHGNHDYRKWWQFGGSGCPPAPHLCIMEPAVDMNSDLRFCAEDLLFGDPNCPNNNPRQGAIRTDTDPE